LGWDHPDEASLAAMLAKQADLLSDTAHLQQVTTEPCDGESRG
jgi:ssRNA-specific RNase YbeY (16S rRNA maturation enzyme)